MSKEKIGIFGSAIQEGEEIAAKARELGEVLASYDVILITGACSGLPYQTILAAYKKNSTEIWGFSPARDYQEQVGYTPKDDNTIYARLIYTPPDFEFINDVNVARKYRNVFSTATCDGGIVVSGRWGSLNEFTNLYDMEKVIGVLTGTGGVADILPGLSRQINKPSKALVIFDSSPENLVKQVIEAIRQRKQS